MFGMNFYPLQFDNNYPYMFLLSSKQDPDHEYGLPVHPGDFFIS